MTMLNGNNLYATSTTGGLVFPNVLTTGFATTFVPPVTQEVPAGFYVPVVFPSLARLNERTTDGRKVSSEGFGVHDLPRSIKMQTRSAGGHDGAEICGRLDEVTVDGNNVSGRGWLLNDAVGRRAAFLIKTQALRGNSIDLSVAQEDVGISINETDDGNLSFEMEFRNAKIGATTLCTEPAFHNAGATIPDGWTISGVDDAESVVASLSECSPLHAFEFSTATMEPTFALADFEDPKFDGPTPLVVTDSGFVYGHLAAWGTNHMDAGSLRITPPHSRTDYAYFATGHVLTDAGPIPTGRLVLGGNHAGSSVGWRAAVDHYANTCAAWADVAIGEDAFGIWISGVVRPGTTPEQIHVARASSISGDWRMLGGSLELVAALSVNAPGFPIPRPAGFSNGSGAQLSLTGAGVLAHAVAPKPAVPFTMTPHTQDAFRYLADRFAAEEARAIVDTL